MSEPEFEVTFAVTQKIPDERVRDLLCSALEGGSNYWYANATYHFEGMTREEFDASVYVDKSRYWPWPGYHAPFMRGCWVTIDEVNDDCTIEATHRIDRASMLKALTLMANSDKVPRRHWADFLAENEDADTGDVFLQLCCFDEIKYG